MSSHYGGASRRILLVHLAEHRLTPAEAKLAGIFADGARNWRRKADVTSQS